MPRDRRETKRDPPSEQIRPSTTSTASSLHSANPALAGMLERSGGAKRARLGQGSASSGGSAPGFKLAPSGGIKHQLNGFLKPPSKKSNHATLAKAAVGRGIRHGYSAQSSDNAVETRPAATAEQSTGMAFLDDPPQLGMSVESSLSELTSNYLKAQGNGNSTASATTSAMDNTARHVPNAGASMLSRESSLVDLAMLPTLPLPGPPQNEETNTDPFTFIDFPNQDSYDVPPSDDKS